ncbi:hypothetical protein [Kribbella soli]|uniref:Tachylectin n=1 Tax=Kribbella soli TaxID=1124743 RepID=A0A4R0HEV6_9ACTN|nr:hypothetical protein [Kribbella soli]TCC07920.1 hypothetical protein E0H45_18455 [Kribbella soli]
MRKPILAGATALTVAAAGLVAVALPTTAAVSDVPADCGVSTAAYRSDGQRVAYVYSEQKTSILATVNDKLGWIPTALQQRGGGGDDTHFESTDYATHPTDGYIYLVRREGELVNGTWTITSSTATRLQAGFAGTRILAYGYPYLYRVAGTALYRYTQSPTTGALGSPVKIASTNWDTVNTLVYERSGGTGDAAVDVLLGTKANGELKEWRINRATPTNITSKVLKASGWSGITSLSTGSCNAHPDGRPLLAIATSSGKASVHFDAKRTDGIGTDIKGGSLGALGWTAKAYGQ